MKKSKKTRYVVVGIAALIALFPLATDPEFGVLRLTMELQSTVDMAGIL